MTHAEEIIVSAAFRYSVLERRTFKVCALKKKATFWMISHPKIAAKKSHVVTRVKLRVRGQRWGGSGDRFTRTRRVNSATRCHGEKLKSSDFHTPALPAHSVLFWLLRLPRVTSGGGFVAGFFFFFSSFVWEKCDEWKHLFSAWAFPLLAPGSLWLQDWFLFQMLKIKVWRPCFFFF